MFVASSHVLFGRTYGAPRRTHGHHPRHRRQRASSAATSSPRSSTPGTASSASCATRGARPRSCDAASSPASGTRSRRAVGDVTRPATLPAALAGVDAVVHLAAIPRDFDGGAEPPARQHRGHPQRRPRRARGRRPAVRPPGRAGRRRRPGAALRELEGQGDGDRARERPRLDDPRAVAAVRAARRVLQHPRRPRPDVAGRRPDHRHGRRRASSRWRSTTWPASWSHVLADDSTIRPRVPARRAALLDLPRDRRGGPRGHGQAAGPRPDAGAADPPRRRLGRARPPPVPRRDRPAAPAASSTTSAPWTRSRPRSASSPGRWRAASPTSRGRSREQEPERDRRSDDLTTGAADADRLRSAPCTRVRTLLLALAWLAAAVLIALGAAGIVASMNHCPATPARPELTWTGDRAAEAAMLDARPTSSSTLADEVDALGSTARQALTAVAAGDVDDARDDHRHGHATRSATVKARRPSSTRRSAPSRASARQPELHAVEPMSSATTRSPRRRGVTDGLETDWAAFSGRALDAAHAHQPARPARRSRPRRRRAEGPRRHYQPARSTCSTTPTRRSPRRATSATSSRARPTSRRSPRWIDRNAAYDAALRHLYEALLESNGRVTDRVRAAFDGEQAARRQLPAGHPALVVIMSDIAQGGLNQAVISIEEARGSLARRSTSSEQLQAAADARPGLSGPRRLAAAAAGTLAAQVSSLVRPVAAQAGREPTGRIPSCRSASSPPSRGRPRPTSSSCPSSASPTSPAPFGELDRRTGGELARAPGVRRAPRQALRHRARRRPASCPARRVLVVSAGQAERARPRDRAQVRAPGRSGG